MRLYTESSVSSSQFQSSASDLWKKLGSRSAPTLLSMTLELDSRRVTNKGGGWERLGTNNATGPKLPKLPSALGLG
jgi:hypothetical protein